MPLAKVAPSPPPAPKKARLKKSKMSVKGARPLNFGVGSFVLDEASSSYRRGGTFLELVRA